MIFLDESGDLSFNFDTDRTPRYFVVSAVVCEDAKKPSRIAKKALLSIDLNTRKRRNGVVLHANRELSRVRKKLLMAVVANDLSSTSIVLDKYRYLELGVCDKVELYALLVVEAVVQSGVTGSVEVILSKRESKSTINDRVRGIVSELLKGFGIEASVSIKMHHVAAGLIVADFIANAVFLEKEAGNSEYKTIICRQDKTLAAFMLSHPAPLQQGIYLSCLEYIKKYRKSKGSK